MGSEMCIRDRYNALVSGIKAEHPWDTQKLLSYGKPDLIYSQDLLHCYLVYTNPVKVVFLDIPIVGKTKFTELDYIPDNFKEYIYENSEKNSYEEMFNINESKIGMDRQDWLSKVNYASLAFAEEDLVCYRAGLQFYYFKNDKLVRVDEGVSEENINLNIRHLEE